MRGEFYFFVFILFTLFFSGLVGVACDNFTIVVIDEEIRRIVRHFKGHNGRITDIVS